MFQSAVIFLQLVDKDKHFSNSHEVHMRRNNFQVS